MSLIHLPFGFKLSTRYTRLGLFLELRAAITVGQAILLCSVILNLARGQEFHGYVWGASEIECCKEVHEIRRSKLAIPRNSSKMALEA